MTPSIKNHYSYDQHGYIDRSDFQQNFLSHINIYRFGNDVDSIKRVFLEVLLGLINSKAAKSKEEFFSQNIISGGYKKTIKIRLNINHQVHFQDRIYLNISRSPYALIADEYLIGASIGTLNFIYKPSKYQKTKNSLDPAPLLKLSSTPIMVDKNLTPIFNKLIAEHFNKNTDLETIFENLSFDHEQINNNKKRLVVLLQQNFLFIYFITFFDEKRELNKPLCPLDLTNFDAFENLVSEAIKKITDSDWADVLALVKGPKTSNLIRSCLKFYPNWASLDVSDQPLKLFYTLNKRGIAEKLKLLESLLLGLTNVHRSLSEIDKRKNLILDILVIKKLISSNFNVFYMSYYYDFRGRIYSTSIVNPIYNKFSRSLFSICSQKESFENLQKSKYYEKYLGVIESEKSIKFSKILTDISSNGSDTQLFLAAQCLMDLGVLNKKKLIKEKGSILRVNDFIIEGERLYFNYREEVQFDVYDTLKIHKLIMYIHNISCNDLRTLNFERDSTFSALLHWAYLLKPKSDVELRNLNLLGNG